MVHQLRRVGATLSENADPPSFFSECAMRKEFDSKSPDDLATMFPGRTISVECGNLTIPVKVHPLPLAQLHRIRKAISEIMREVGDIGTFWAQVKSLNSAVIPVLVGVAVDHCLEIINDCVEGIDLMHPRTPHWVLPSIALAWIEESFGSEHKTNPWADLIEMLGTMKSAQSKTDGQ